ncbi:hypothetical protein FE840_009940 [Peteryoungia desertarenae]|uniref:Uncharacterized protein n=1 Tax=Peteryoungia desertarenae TaxID=1813451 RepID=A0ABX6QNV2_9HYPH|nr:hypothetical protein [Peteryoungia desertarenae]QLF69835.1 hypothetical protein FE840_009940 [Peteryoungia desertarenae]
MSTLLTINVRSQAALTQDFFFFQEPAVYTGGSQVYSNSLFSGFLSNFTETGSVLTFKVNLQYYAGIQQSNSLPRVGASTGFASAAQPIDLASVDGSGNDWTTATISPALGLSVPVNGSGVQAGAFRITTPTFSSPPYYNVGSAVNANGSIILSNFVQVNPASHTDCQPILKFYVQTGQYTPGTVMNFTQSSVNAAICDFTGGYTTCNVTLNANGSWSTKLL